MTRDSCPYLDGSLCEAVLPIEGPVEAVPGIWDSGGTSGLALLAALEEDALLTPGQAVAEVRAGLVHSEVCECGALDTSLIVPRAADRCGDCGALMLSESQRDACESCGLVGNFVGQALHSELPRS